MRRLFKIIIVLTFGLFLLAGGANAIPMLSINDGITTTTFTDTDKDGVVVYHGSFGAYAVNVATGISKPVIGNDSVAVMDLNSVNVSGDGGGPLTIMFTDVDFKLDDLDPGFLVGIGGTTTGSVSYQAYLDDSNTAFGRGTLLADLGSFKGFFSDKKGGSILPSLVDELFSLTIVVTIDHNDGFGFSSFNAVNKVPEPGTLFLFGFGLIGLASVTRIKFLNR